MDRIETIQNDLEEHQAAFLLMVSAERTAAIKQLRAALKDTVKVSRDRATESIHTQPSEAVDPLVDRLGQERTLFLDDLASRQTELFELMTEFSETISVSGTIARKLTDSAEAIVDQVFWRGIILIFLLIVGFGLLRLVPQRNVGRRNAKPNP